MIARVAHGEFRKTPRNFVKVEKAKNKSGNETKLLSYDYNAALSQPDLTDFFHKEDNKISTENKKIPEGIGKVDVREDNSQVEKREELRVETEVPQTSEDAPKIKKEINGSTEGPRKLESVRSLGSKSDAVGKKATKKLTTVKCPKTSRIPRSGFTGFSKLPLRSKAKNSSTTRLAIAKSQRAIASEGRQIASNANVKPMPEAAVVNVKSSDQSISVVASGTSK